MGTQPNQVVLEVCSDSAFWYILSKLERFHFMKCKRWCFGWKCKIQMFEMWRLGRMDLFSEIQTLTSFLVFQIIIMKTNKTNSLLLWICKWFLVKTRIYIWSNFKITKLYYWFRNFKRCTKRSMNFFMILLYRNEITKPLHQKAIKTLPKFGSSQVLIILWLHYIRIFKNFLCFYTK